MKVLIEADSALQGERRAVLNEGHRAAVVAANAKCRAVRNQQGARIDRGCAGVTVSVGKHGCASPILNETCWIIPIVQLPRHRECAPGSDIPCDRGGGDVFAIDREVSAISGDADQAQAARLVRAHDDWISARSSIDDDVCRQTTLQVQTTNPEVTVDGECRVGRGPADIVVAPLSPNTPNPVAAGRKIRVRGPCPVVGGGGRRKEGR